MKFAIAQGDFKKHHDCLVVGVYEQNDLTPTAGKLDKISQGYIRRLLKQGEISGKTGETLLLHHVPHLNVDRVLLVGCGKINTLSERDFRKLIQSSTKAVCASKTSHAASFLAEVALEKHDLAWKIKQSVEVSADALYVFDQFKSAKKTKRTLTAITFYIEDKRALNACEKAFKQGLATVKGMELTKDLANLPSNICTPSYLAKQAQALAKEYKNLHVKILEEKDMAKLGLGAFLAVAKGSDNDAKLICIEYKGTAKKQSPVALVGKGITFDTGGLSLKPADAMVGMKYDMCGAATVLGTIKAIAELKLPIHVVGVLAAAENMPSGVATKPEDIVTTLSGQTVEIMNTDAEGRLVLCDALTYCERFKPDTVIDIATLTGAVVIALGHHATGLVSNHEPLAQALLTAGQETYDRAWQLPLWDEFQDQLNSPFADMSNIGGRTGGTITAACFLSRFAKKFHWAHLDVAGTAAMMGGNDRYATGRPVPLLVQYLINRTS